MRRRKHGRASSSPRVERCLDTAGSTMLACRHDGSSPASSRRSMRARFARSTTACARFTFAARRAGRPAILSWQPVQRGARDHAVLERRHAQGLLQEPRGAAGELLRHDRPARRDEGAGRSRQGQGAARPRCQPDRKSRPPRLPGSRARSHTCSSASSPRASRRTSIARSRACRRSRRTSTCTTCSRSRPRARRPGGSTRRERTRPSRRCRPATRSRSG